MSDICKCINWAWAPEMGKYRSDGHHPRCGSLPEKIYLQIGEEASWEEVDISDATWCADRVFDNDIEYLLYLPAEVEEALQALERLAIGGQLGMASSKHTLKLLTKVAKYRKGE